jgi:hypothetical protein
MKSISTPLRSLGNLNFLPRENVPHGKQGGPNIVELNALANGCSSIVATIAIRWLRGSTKVHPEIYHVAPPRWVPARSSNWILIASSRWSVADHYAPVAWYQILNRSLLWDVCSSSLPVGNSPELTTTHINTLGTLPVPGNLYSSLPNISKSVANTYLNLYL